MAFKWTDSPEFIVAIAGRDRRLCCSQHHGLCKPKANLIHQMTSILIMLISMATALLAFDYIINAAIHKSIYFMGKTIDTLESESKASNKVHHRMDDMETSINRTDWWGRMPSRTTCEWFWFFDRNECETNENSRKFGRQKAILTANTKRNWMIFMGFALTQAYKQYNLDRRHASTAAGYKIVPCFFWCIFLCAVGPYTSTMCTLYCWFASIWLYWKCIVFFSFIWPGLVFPLSVHAPKWYFVEMAILHCT